MYHSFIEVKHGMSHVSLFGFSLNAYVKSHKFACIHSDTFIEWNYLKSNDWLSEERTRKRDNRWSEWVKKGTYGSKWREEKKTLLLMDSRRGHHQNHNYFPIFHWSMIYLLKCIVPFWKYHIKFGMSMQNKNIDHYVHFTRCRFSCHSWIRESTKSIRWWYMCTHKKTRFEKAEKARRNPIKLGCFYFYHQN